MNPCSFDQLSTGRDRDRIPTMPRTDTRFAAVALTFAATLAIVAPASARSSLLDDDAPVLRRALAAGMKVTDDDLFQIRTGEAVFGPGRELESVPGSSLTGLRHARPDPWNDGNALIRKVLRYDCHGAVRTR
jgi:hypothetical protein